jgi:hypothetical protein
VRRGLPDPRPGLEALEARDLILELVDALLELLDPLLLEENDVEQLAHRRRVFGLRDVGQRDRDGPTLPIIRPSHPGAVAFLRSGHQAVWGR